MDCVTPAPISKAPGCVQPPHGDLEGLKKVVVVGVGPGEADLLTVRAFAALERADVVVADADVPASLLARACTPWCRVIRADGASQTPLLAEFARAGVHAVRAVRGPGTGAETAELADAGLLAETVAGLPCGPAIAPLPMDGWQVLLPRALKDSGPLRRALGDVGADCEFVVTASLEAPRSSAALDRALAALTEGAYGWVVLSSPAAAQVLRRWFSERGLDARELAGVKIAVSAACVPVLTTGGLEPDAVIESGESLADGLPAYDPDADPHRRVLVLAAEDAGAAIAGGAAQLGWQPDVVAALRVKRSLPPSPEIRAAIKRGRYDAVVFTSPDCVRDLVGIAGKPHRRSLVACLDAATLEAAHEMGVGVDAVSPDGTEVGLAAALAAVAMLDAERQIASGGAPRRPSQRRYVGARVNVAILETDLAESRAGRTA